MTRTRDSSPASGPSSDASVWRWSPGAAGRRDRDQVAVEEPLELRIDSRSVAVLMRTPGHDEELAAGFLLAEGVIRSRRDLLDIRRHPRNRGGHVLDVFLAPTVKADFTKLTRHVFSASSCGLCGTASIAAVQRMFPRVRSRLRVDPEVLRLLPARMREAQAGFEATGGIHAAGLFDAGGRLLSLREDVGRHNAVDKILGRALLEGALPLGERVLLVSSRASFEILHKALAGGIAVVASVSAPSSLAVEFAKRSRQTLVGFLRGDRFNVYSRPARVRGSVPKPKNRIATGAVLGHLAAVIRNRTTTS